MPMYNQSPVSGAVAGIRSATVPTMGVLGDSFAQNQFQDVFFGGLAGYVRSIQPQFSFVAQACYLSGGAFHPDPYSFEGYSGKRTDEILTLALGPTATTNWAQTTIAAGIQNRKPTFTLVTPPTNDLNQTTRVDLASGAGLARAIAGQRALWAYVRACGSSPIAMSLLPGNGTWQFEPTAGATQTATITELRALKPAWNAALKAAATADGVPWFDGYAVTANPDGSWLAGMIQGSYTGGPFNGNLVGEDPFGIHPGLNAMQPLGAALSALTKTLIAAAPSVPRLYPGGNPIQSAAYVADARGGWVNFDTGLFPDLSNISFDINQASAASAALLTPTIDIAGGGTVQISKPTGAVASVSRAYAGPAKTVVAGQSYLFRVDVRVQQGDPFTTMSVQICDGTSGSGSLNQPLTKYGFTGGQSRTAIDTGVLTVMLPFVVPAGVNSLKAYLTIEGSASGTAGGTDRLSAANLGMRRLS
jgi:hypothetical protein